MEKGRHLASGLRRTWMQVSGNTGAERTISGIVQWSHTQAAMFSGMLPKLNSPPWLRDGSAFHPMISYDQGCCLDCAHLVQPVEFFHSRAGSVQCWRQDANHYDAWCNMTDFRADLPEPAGDVVHISLLLLSSRQVTRTTTLQYRVCGSVSAG